MASAIPTSRTYTALELTQQFELDDISSATLFCRGGGYFQKGVVVGTTTGFVNGCIQYDTKNEVFTGVINSKLFNFMMYDIELNAQIDNRIMYLLNDTLQFSNIYVDANDIKNAELIETQYIVPPSGNTGLIIDKMEFPTTAGVAGATLKVLTPGVLYFDTNPAATYSIPSTSLTLPVFVNTVGLLNSSGLTVSGASYDTLNVPVTINTANINASLITVGTGSPVTTIDTTTGVTSTNVHVTDTLLVANLTQIDLDGITQTSGNLNIKTQTGDNLYFQDSIYVTRPLLFQDNQLVVQTRTKQMVFLSTTQPEFRGDPGDPGTLYWDEQAGVMTLYLKGDSFWYSTTMTLLPL